MNLDKSEKEPRAFKGYLLILPVLATMSMVAAALADNWAEKAAFPFWYYGRNGLTLWDTLWDADVFWGTIWFTLMVILVISAFINMKFPPGDDDAFKTTPEVEKRITIVSVLVAAGLFVAMAITWTPRFDVVGNWFPTQFAYQVPVWPGLIAFFGILFVPMNRGRGDRVGNTPSGDQGAGGKRLDEENGGNDGKVSSGGEVTRGGVGRGRLPVTLVLLCGASAIATYLGAITEFHPHAIAGAGMQLYTLVMTVAFPGCLLALVFELLKSRPLSKKNPSKKLVIPWLLLLGIDLSIVAIIQWLATMAVPGIGVNDMFSFNLDSTWPTSHWPSWVFTGACVLAITFGTRMLYRYRLGRGVASGHAAARRAGRRATRRATRTVAPRLSSRSEKAAVALVLAAIIISPSVVVSSGIAGNALGETSPLLLVNQVGYYPNGPKRIIYQVPGENATLPSNATFEVIDASSGGVVYSGVLEKNVSRYGFSYMVGSFDDLNVTGRYLARATVNGVEVRSHEFGIAPDIYDHALEMALRFFYYQRDNYEVKEVVPGYPGHHAGHMDDAQVWNGTDWIHHDLTGGWFDAGDYNKYNSWFQTQWYCVQAIAESALLDPGNFHEKLPDLYDSGMPDVVDEALWGAKFLINCVNDEGIQGDEYRYMVWETVSGYRHAEGRYARMSYWGPPEFDWTTPRRVDLNAANSTFVGYHRGYDIAGALMHVARMMDTYSTSHPGIQFPDWAVSNTSLIRELATKVYDKYIAIQGNKSDDVQSIIGKLYYLEEKSLFENNWSSFDDMVSRLINNSISPTLDNIPDTQDYPLWFGWSGYYLLGNLLTHYLNNSRTGEMPQALRDKVQQIQDNHFSLLFDEPFRVKHSRVDEKYAKGNVLFYGKERQTDMLTSAWLQALITRLDGSIGKPGLTQAYLDWIFGMNPAGICMMEGLGSVNFPQYHHRLGFARNPRGAVPGALPNGIALATTSRAKGIALGVNYSDDVDDELEFLAILGDRPFVATWPGNPLMRDGVPSNPNEVWIPHDAMLIRILTSLKVDNPFG